MGKKNNTVPKETYDSLLSEANDINKFKVNSNIKELLKDVKLSKKQTQLFNLLNENEIVTITGPAGTSKTFMALYNGLHFLTINKSNKLFLTKPIVEAGEKLGFLPGDIDEKLDPYLQSYIDILNELIGKSHTMSLFSSGRIVFEPVAYLRGRNIHDSYIIIDEAQNYTEKQLMTIVTRKCSSSRIVILGDEFQDDRFNLKTNPFRLFKEHILKPIKKNVALFDFTVDDIVRDKLIIDIIKNYEKYLNRNTNGN